MSLNQVTSGERLHIGFFGMRNAGKSSVVNAVTGQQLSVVSDVKGTTTDPVQKAMELLPLGPVVIIDTPGLDDEGALGALRMEKTRQILEKTDIAVLVVDALKGMSPEDAALKETFSARGIPFITVYNKAELPGAALPEAPGISVSALTGQGIGELKERLGALAPKAQHRKVIVSDLIDPGDIVVLVTPIDESAPKGRLILPQQMTIRDILDSHAMAVVTQDTELPATLAGLHKKPRLVITDSQAFGRVSKMTPDDITLTSFSILMARYKGDLKSLIAGANMLGHLKDGDKVLISEGCTHHRQCNDIGTVKMPGWIRAFSGSEPDFTFTSGNEFPQDLSPFRLIVHCGACMLNEQAMKSRTASALAAGVPMVNYGIAIAHMNGILQRSVALFPDIAALLAT